MLVRFARNRSGASAVEFAMIAPILAGIIAMGWSVWQGEAGAEHAKTALRAGSEYYTAGGTSDATAQSVALNAWASPPPNASVTASRACYCAGSAVSCTTACSVGQQRTVYVTLTASGSGQGVFGGQTQTQQEVVRVE
jgi:Flp pilus assembly protein TadG